VLGTFAMLPRAAEWYPTATIRAQVEQAMLANLHAPPIVITWSHCRLALEHGALHLNRLKTSIWKMSTKPKNRP
jgi:hypothetical protein